MEEHAQHSQRAAVVEKRTAYGALAGAAAGILVGVPLGLAHGFGRITVPGLEPLNGAGAAVPSFVFAVVLAALFALIGGLVTIGRTEMPAGHHQGGGATRALRTRATHPRPRRDRDQRELRVVP